MTSLYGIDFHISWTPPIQRGGVDAVRYKIINKCFDSNRSQRNIKLETNSYNLELPSDIEDTVCSVSVGIVRAPRYPDGLFVKFWCVETRLRCELMSSQTVPCQ